MPNTVRTVCVPIASLTVEQAVHATLEAVLEMKGQQGNGLDSAVAHIESNTAAIRQLAEGLRANREGARA